MIDFVKMIIKDFSSSQLEDNPLLEFYREINPTTAEIKTINRNGKRVTPCKIAHYRGLEFKIYDTGTIIITGNLHRYYNEGKHNYNDFDISSVKWVLSDLKTNFGIEPAQCTLKCLEIGINIIPPIRTNTILDNCFLHKTKPFEYHHNSHLGKYKQVKHSQYIIKLYNKALHYSSKGFKIDTEIMRFEIKYIKMAPLNKMGIYTLQNLIDYGLQNFKNQLITEWRNVLYYDDSIQQGALNKSTKKAILEYSNPNYWMRLLKNKQIKNFRYHKNHLKEITLKNSINTQSSISEIMNKKIDLLN